jgi:hypothetical protein
LQKTSEPSVIMISSVASQVVGPPISCTPVLTILPKSGSKKLARQQRAPSVALQSMDKSPPTGMMCSYSSLPLPLHAAELHLVSQDPSLSSHEVSKPEVICISSELQVRSAAAAWPMHIMMCSAAAAAAKEGAEIMVGSGVIKSKILMRPLLCKKSCVVVFGTSWMVLFTPI